VLGLVLDGESIEKISGGNVNQSGANTTFSGRGSLNYHGIPVTMFSRLGLLSDPAESVANGIVAMMKGETLPCITEREIRERRKL
jgi:hypothetical protein